MSNEPVTLDGSKILIIDDVPENVLVLTEVLEAEGYSISFATNGDDGLKMASLDLPDLILLDVMMPVMNGFEICRRLKSIQTTRNIPVIFVTAKGDTSDIVEGFRLGAVDYIGKPIRHEEVCARVHTHLQLQALISERDQLIDLLREHNAEIRRISGLDPLTKLANRYSFNEALEREWRHMPQQARPLALLFIDIDDFKPYNDTYGHPAGDECLKRIAEQIKNILEHPSDLACRYGGEEFVVILHNTNAENAKTVAETLRRNIETMALVHSGSQVAPVVTISVGVTAFDPVTQGTSLTRDTLIKTADRALYQAKHEGRNRVMFMTC